MGVMASWSLACGAAKHCKDCREDGQLAGWLAGWLALRLGWGRDGGAAVRAGEHRSTEREWAGRGCMRGSMMP